MPARVARPPVFSVERLVWELAKLCVAAAPDDEQALRTAMALSPSFSKMVENQVRLYCMGHVTVFCECVCAWCTSV